MKKRFAALLCSACMAFTGVYAAMPAAVMTASAANVIDSGTCGENLTWVLDDEGVLIIEGTGEMTKAKWQTDFLESNTKKVIINEGVTTIGNHAFSDFSQLQEVVIPDSVTTIVNSAFQNCSSLEKINIPDSVTSIDKYAFDGCSSLKEITFPLNCSNIGQCVLKNCASLRKVTFLNSDISTPGLMLHPERLIPEYVVEFEQWAISNNEVEIITYEEHKSVKNEPEFKGTIYAYSNSRMKDFAKDYCGFEALDTTGLKTIAFDINASEYEPEELEDYLPEKMEMKTLYAESGYTFILPESNYYEPLYKDFAGWEINGKLYQPGDKITVTSDITVKAAWESEKALGDPTGDNKTDSKDATLILVEYAAAATGGESTMTAPQRTAADVNKDSKIDSKDASAILSYYSYTATGGKKNLEDFIKYGSETPEDK